MKKILIVTPRSPFQGRGADEQDRLYGIKWFKNHGFEVEVITMVMESDLPHIEKARTELGVSITPVSYKFQGRKKIFKRLFNPLYWDGAAFEYFDDEIQNTVKKKIETFRPHLVWFDYTYLWPLYRHAKKKGIPIITRSINFEASHFLDEDGRNLLNYLRAIPKFKSEWLSFIWSNFFFSITIKEEHVYRKIGSTPIQTLPLRALPERVIPRVDPNNEKIRIGFMPSTYTVEHNRQALLRIIEAAKRVPNASIHVTGQKLPEEIRTRLPSNVVYEGFVPSSIEFWQSCDIAVAPSVFGGGMQQKIFEPLTLGVPTITSKRGLAGYPFICGEDVICAETSEEIAGAIIDLSKDKMKRDRLSKNAQKKAGELFSQERIDGLLNNALQKLNI
jgi:glycosyltransferase involved in cell wall biosynthesis